MAPEKETQGRKVRVAVELLRSASKFRELFSLACVLPSIFERQMAKASPCVHLSWRRARKQAGS